MGGADCTRSTVCRALQILKRISCMVPKTTRPRLMAVVVPAVPLLPWGTFKSCGSSAGPRCLHYSVAGHRDGDPGGIPATFLGDRGSEDVLAWPVSRFPSVATQPETSVSWARPGGDHGRELTLIPAGVGVPHTRPAA